MQTGDIILFKGEGFLFKVLSGILCLVDKEWRQRKFKPWHVAFVSRFWDGQPVICEALIGGVQENILDDKREYKSYHWLEIPVDPHDFVDSHLGLKYDVAQYLFTSLQYLIRHFWNRRIPRLLDNSYTCWELVAEFVRDNGKPFQVIYDCPTINDIVRVLDENILGLPDKA